MRTEEEGTAESGVYFVRRRKRETKRVDVRAESDHGIVGGNVSGRVGD